MVLIKHKDIRSLGDPNGTPRSKCTDDGCDRSKDGDPVHSTLALATCCFTNPPHDFGFEVFPACFVGGFETATEIFCELAKWHGRVLLLQNASESGFYAQHGFNSSFDYYEDASDARRSLFRFREIFTVITRRNTTQPSTSVAPSNSL